MNTFRTLHRTILLLFAVVVIAIVTLVHFTIAKIVAEQARAQQRSQSPAISLIVEQLLKPLHVSETLGKSRELIDLMDAEEVDEEVVFSALSRLEQEFDMTFFIASETQQTQYNSDGTKHPLIEGEVNWYFKYKVVDDDTVADIGKWEDPHFYIDLKMYNDNGKFLGFFGIGKRLASFIQLFAQYKATYGYDFLFVDPDGDIMLSSDPLLMASSSNFTNLNMLPWFTALPESVQETRNLNNRLVTIEGDDHLIAEVELNQFDWTVYLISPLNQRQTAISKGFIISVIVLLFIVFTLFLLISNLLFYFKKDLQPKLVANEPSNLPDKQKMMANYTRLAKEFDSLSMVVVEVDNLAEINERCGRSVGDDVLRKTSLFISEQLVDKQVLGRWSRSQLLILLPGIGPNEATKLANNFRHGVATLPAPHGFPDTLITASFGVSYTSSLRPVVEVASHAEEALAQAQRGGQNQVHMQLIQ